MVVTVQICRPPGCEAMRFGRNLRMIGRNVMSPPAEQNSKQSPTGRLEEPNYLPESL